MFVLKHRGQSFRKSTFSGSAGGNCVYLSERGVLDSKAMMALPGKVNIAELVRVTKAS